MVGDTSVPPLLRLPREVMTLLFEGAGIYGRLFLAHHAKSARLIELVRRDIFHAKYGAFTLTEEGAPLAEVLTRMRFSVTHIPYAIGLRIESDVLVPKFPGEWREGDLSLVELGMIFQRVNHILRGLNDTYLDFPTPGTLLSNRDIKRRRIRLSVLYQKYLELFRQTALHFPNLTLEPFRPIGTPPVLVARAFGYELFGLYSWDRKYDFSIGCKDDFNCHFSINLIGDTDMACTCAPIYDIENHHLVMLKMIAALFFRQPQRKLSIQHPLNLVPLLYQVGLLPFNRGRESALSLAATLNRRLDEVLALASHLNWRKEITLVDKEGLDPVMIPRLHAVCGEVVFLYDGSPMI